MLKKLLVVALVVAVAGVFINDVGRFARARYDLDDATNHVVDETAFVAGSMSRDKAAMEADRVARERGIRVYQYDQNGTGIQVWTEIEVPGTFVLGRSAAMMAKRPSDSAYVLKDYGTSVYR